MTFSAEHGQTAYARRFDWGPTGALALAADARPGDVAVVIDVLSFTTTLSLAVERGIEVYPYPWATADAPSYAEQRGAVLARGRREGLASGGISLSPASFGDVAGVERVVLPSPNGSTISFALADAGVQVVGASLRNATAVGRWLSGVEGRVWVVAAGERWPDGSLRPAAEDLWGGGAVLSALGSAQGPAGASPEAGLAVAAYDAVRGSLAEALRDCASGRELASAGFGGDVDLAAALDASDVVPLLRGEAFVDASRGPAGQEA